MIRLALILSVGIVIGSLLVIRRQMRLAVEHEAQMGAVWIEAARLHHQIASSKVFMEAVRRRQLVGNEDFKEWEREFAFEGPSA